MNVTVPGPPAPLEAVCAEVAADQMPTETQEYTESSGSPPEVFGNPLSRSGTVLSLLELAGLLSRKKKKSQHISNNSVAISVFLNPTTIMFGLHHGNTNWPESLTLAQWT